MEYNKIRKKVNKFYGGGKIPKYNRGSIIQKMKERGIDDNTIGTLLEDFNYKEGVTNDNQFLQMIGIGNSDHAIPTAEQESVTLHLAQSELNDDLGLTQTPNQSIYDPRKNRDYGALAASETQRYLDDAEDAPINVNSAEESALAAANIQKTAEATGIDAALNAAAKDKRTDKRKAIGLGIAASVLPGAMAAMDSLTSDKNFGAQSQAIDSAVHGVSGALMSSGNPYAMAAGAALEGVNFLTKAGGQTVQGYDVNIENSGYGNLGHQESSSSRSFLFGLGDITGKKMQAKLARRNEQARMALQAAEISEDVKFEQEARMNSVDNVLRNNQIALAGGIDTSLLGN